MILGLLIVCRTSGGKFGMGMCGFAIIALALGSDTYSPTVNFAS